MLSDKNFEMILKHYIKKENVKIKKTENHSLTEKKLQVLKLQEKKDLEIINYKLNSQNLHYENVNYQYCVRNNCQYH